MALASPTLLSPQILAMLGGGGGGLPEYPTSGLSGPVSMAGLGLGETGMGMSGGGGGAPGGMAPGGTDMQGLLDLLQAQTQATSGGPPAPLGQYGGIGAGAIGQSFGAGGELAQGSGFPSEAGMGTQTSGDILSLLKQAAGAGKDAMSAWKMFQELFQGGQPNDVGLAAEEGMGLAGPAAGGAGFGGIAGLTSLADLPSTIGGASVATGLAPFTPEYASSLLGGAAGAFGTAGDVGLAAETGMGLAGPGAAGAGAAEGAGAGLLSSLSWPAALASIFAMSGAFGEDVQGFFGTANREQAINQPREQAGVMKDLGTAMPFLQQAPGTLAGLQAGQNTPAALQQAAEEAYRQVLQGPVYSRAFNAPFGNPMPGLGDLTTPGQLQSHLSLAYARDALAKQGLPPTTTANAPGIGGMSMAQFLQGFKGTAGLGGKQFVSEGEPMGEGYIPVSNAAPGQTLPEAYKILLALNPALATTLFGQQSQGLLDLLSRSA